MPVLHCKLERRQAIIDIGVQRFVPSAGPLQSHDLALQIPVNCYRALIDTGAQRTCLSRNAIAAENLNSHSKRVIQNVHSQEVHRLYFINIGFMVTTEGVNGSESERSYYAVERPCEAINIADNENFDDIIGMDVLEQFDFQFEKTGDFYLKLP